MAFISVFKVMFVFFVGLAVLYIIKNFTDNEYGIPAFINFLSLICITILTVCFSMFLCVYILSMIQ